MLRGKGLRFYIMKVAEENLCAQVPQNVEKPDARLGQRSDVLEMLTSRKMKGNERTERYNVELRRTLTLYQWN